MSNNLNKTLKLYKLMMRAHKIWLNQIKKDCDYVNNLTLLEHLEYDYSSIGKQINLYDIYKIYFNQLAEILDHKALLIENQVLVHVKDEIILLDIINNA